MFSIEKNEILTSSWIGKSLNKNDVLPKQATCRMKTLYIQNNDFMRNKKLNLCKF